MARRSSLALAAGLLSAAVLGGCASTEQGAPTEARASERSRVRQTAGSEILVTLPAGAARPWSSVMAELQSEYGLQPMASWPMEALGVQCILFQSLGGIPIESLVRSLDSDPRVEMAQLNQVFTVQEEDGGKASSYDDPYAELQYASGALGLAQAHRLSTGVGVDIAVIDTGVDVTHPDLLERVSVARNFVRDDNEEFTGDLHGTAVAGIIGALAGNGEGIVGVAPGARMRALKACWYADGRTQRALCTTYTLAQALDYGVAQGVDILNLSLGGPRDPLLERLVERALELGIVVVAAAGPDEGPFPASVPGVISVRACDSEGHLWPAVAGGAGEAGAGALVAPGVEVLTLAPSGGYDFLTGSSLAAAHATGIAALLLARQPDLGPAGVANLLAETATPWQGGAGPPVLNACAAVARLAGGRCDS